MKILVTGGAGYIGSHTVIELQAAGHQVVIIDNLSNSHPAVLDRIAAISGSKPAFHKVDLCDRAATAAVFAQEHPEAVIHFAAHKAVDASVAHPLAYYANNVGGMLNLLESMQQHKVHQLVFSSSATVYGEPATVPLAETAPLKPINPYGQTKLIGEQLLADLAASEPAWRIVSLRYFNPVGAHPSGQLGEDPTGVPDNLLPFIAQVAGGRQAQLKVFGDDYDTPDGTGVRDYVHVMDVAAGHLAALTHLPQRGQAVYNLGTGTGSSVLEVLHAFEAASGKPIPYTVAPRRAGDPASCYADVSKAAADLDWQATRTLAQACADVWRWQTNHPRGYAD